MKAICFIIIGGALLYILDRLFGYGTEVINEYGYMMERESLLVFIFLYLMVIVAPLLFLLLIGYKKSMRVSPINQKKARIDILKARHINSDTTKVEHIRTSNK